MSENSGQTSNQGSAGGHARAKSLTAEQRAAISRKAAAARWKVPMADCPVGTKQIGTWIMQCAHLDDGRRVISQRSFMDLLEMKGRGDDPGHRIARLIESSALMSPKMNALRLAIRNPIRYIPMENAQIAFGYEGTLIVDFCEAIMDLRSLGMVEGDVFKRYAHAAEKFIRGLAKTGIIAVIDEATGYQTFRSRDALARILEEYIAKDLQPWTKTFPEDFYKQIFRLRKWDWLQPRISRPGIVGRWTNDFVYERLAPGVLDELRIKNPKLETGRRKDKHHQWLTGEVGHPQLRGHLDGVIRILKGSRTWGEFRNFLDRFYPKLKTAELGFQFEATRKPMPTD